MLMALTTLEVFANRLTSPTFLFAANLVIAQTALWDWQSSKSLARARNMFFGMRVTPEFIASNIGITIHKRFRQRIWLWSLAVIAGYYFFLWRPLYTPKDLITAVLPPLLASAGNLLMFALANRETVKLAILSLEPPTRTASLFVEQEESNAWLTTLDWFAILFPIVLPLATIGVIALHWNSFPRGYSAQHELITAAQAALIGIFPAGIYLALRFGARSSDWAPTPQASRRYRTVLGLMLWSIFSIQVVQMCGLALLPLLGGLPFQYLLPFMRYSQRATLALLLLLVVAQLYLRKKLARGSSDPMPDRYWKLGMFYHNAADPAVVVPVRSGIGFAVNSANRSVWFIGAIGIATILICLSSVL